MNERSLLHRGIGGSVFVIAIVLALLTTGVLIFWRFGGQKYVERSACAQEAKVCPDGSTVARTGPNCEFAECPGEEIIIFSKETQEVCGLEQLEACDMGGRWGCSQSDRQWGCYFPADNTSDEGDDTIDISV